MGAKACDESPKAIPEHTGPCLLLSKWHLSPWLLTRQAGLRRLLFPGEREEKFVKAWSLALLLTPPSGASSSWEAKVWLKQVLMPGLRALLRVSASTQRGGHQGKKGAVARDNWVSAPLGDGDSTAWGVLACPLLTPVTPQWALGEQGEGEINFGGALVTMNHLPCLYSPHVILRAVSSGKATESGETGQESSGIAVCARDAGHGQESQRSEQEGRQWGL